MDHASASHAQIAEMLAAIEESAEKFLSERGGLALPRRLRAGPDTTLPHMEFEAAHWAEMAALGWLGILVPEAQGGLGLAVDAAAALARRVGRWLAPEPFTAASVAAHLIAAIDTQAARALLTPLVAGQTVIGIDTDLDAAITADVPSGPALLQASARIGRILCAAELLGAAERLHEMTLECAGQRKQFGKAIGGFQVLQHRCVDVRIQIEMARASLADARRARRARDPGA